MEPVNTPFYKSKRFYLNVLAVVAVVVPQTRSFIEAYLVESSSIWAGLNIVLGFISKGKISIS
jgi:hypothetical protein